MHVIDAIQTYYAVFKWEISTELNPMITSVGSLIYIKALVLFGIYWFMKANYEKKAPRVGLWIGNALVLITIISNQVIIFTRT